MENDLDLEETLLFLKIEYERLALLDVMVREVTGAAPDELFEEQGIDKAEGIETLTKAVKDLRDWVEGGIESLEANNVKLPDYCVETADGSIEFLEVDDVRSSTRDRERALEGKAIKTGKNLLGTGLLLAATWLFYPRKSDV